jgi:hypothetical protein
MKRNVVSFRSNARFARQLWGEPSRMARRSLRELTSRYSLSVAAGDLQFLDGRWYVTHAWLLQLATRRGCRGISTMLQEKLSDSTACRWVFKAVVYKSGLANDIARPATRTFLLVATTQRIGSLESFENSAQ